ncbi:uncharacterized protein A4U43_C03F13530 [Asparagus officinalis]|uniref:beta-ketoacyl-[acyl-carrier-protein] synthase I n=1 Tax=Asparagus officinalis TaxID=4686 RepID=A0A5P1F9Q2_ASPOF|nr:uncharacterized protein A4U43_C03F13530 [Asparagus officinalis]
MGNGRDVLVGRGQPVPSDFDGPILVCTQNDDHEVVSPLLLLDGTQRGANIYAEFLGGSFTCDAYHMAEPHPERGCQQRKCSCNFNTDNVKEYQALVSCFGQNPKLREKITKSMIGHLLGASGVVEAIVAI